LQNIQKEKDEEVTDAETDDLTRGDVDKALRIVSNRSGCASLTYHYRKVAEGIFMILSSTKVQPVNQFLNVLNYPLTLGTIGIYTDEEISQTLKKMADDAVICTNKFRFHKTLYGFEATLNNPQFGISNGASQILPKLSERDLSLKPLTFELHMDNLKNEDIISEIEAREQFIADPRNKVCPQVHSIESDGSEESICTLCAGLDYGDNIRRRRETESPGLKYKDTSLSLTQEIDNPSPVKKKTKHDHIFDEHSQMKYLQSKNIETQLSSCLVCNVAVAIEKQYCRKTYCENIGYFFSNGAFSRLSDF